MSMLPYQFCEISIEEQTKIIANLKEAMSIPNNILVQLEAELLKNNIETYLESELTLLLNLKKKAKKAKKVKDPK